MTELFMDGLILHSSALINGKNGEISLFNEEIIWRYHDQNDKVINSVLISDIISVRDNSDFILKHRLIQSPKLICKTSEYQNKSSCVIYSVIARSNTVCQLNILTTLICFKENRHCSQWNDAVKELMHAPNHEQNRPKSLAVFINPIGGSRRGAELYDSQVRPIFELAGIKVRVFVTEKRDEAKEFILNRQSHRVDGLVCVGGDGTLMELIHGLLLKGRLDNGYSEENHNQNSPEFPSPLRVGIIAAGSTDCVAYSTIGTKDAVTSALHIVKGSNIAVDILTVHAEKAFLRYNISLMGYGFYGNCVSESESHRWMGPKRYDWLGFKHFMSLSAYYGELKYLPVTFKYGDPKDGNICEERCTHCSKVLSENESTERQKVDWVTVRDRFVAINSFLISCRCKKSTNGPAPYAHLGNGCSDLVIVRNCNRFNFLKHLLKSAQSEGHFDFDFIETVRVSEFSFTPLCCDKEGMSVDDIPKENCVWNCDGEALYPTTVSCKVHRKLIRLFANGIPKTKRGYPHTATGDKVAIINQIY